MYINEHLENLATAVRYRIVIVVDNMDGNLFLFFSSKIIVKTYIPYHGIVNQSKIKFPSNISRRKK